MARPKYPSDQQDQFMLRLPNGLRDRIKAYAKQHNRSMNAEIIRILEREFPEPFPLTERIKGLVTLSSKIGSVFEGEAIDAIGSNLLDIVEGIASGTVAGVDDKTRQEIADWLKEWKEEVSENTEGYRESFDDEELETYQRTGSTAKVIDLSDEEK